MAQIKKKWVMFHGSNRIPGEATGKSAADAVRVEPGKPIQVTEGYAKHVVADGFAQYCDPPKKPPAKKASETEGANQTDDAAATLDAAQQAAGA